MSGTIQVLEDNPAQPQLKFYSSGNLTDLDSSAVPAVTLTRPDGTAGPASGTVTRVSLGTYTFTLSAANTADPTIYTVVGTGNIGGQQVSDKIRVEVVGDFLFNLADLRAVKVAGALPFNSTDYPDATVLARRAEVTDDFEQRTGWSFVPRFAREISHGRGTCEILLDHLKATKLLSVTINGVAQSLGGFSLSRSGVLYAASNFLPAGWIQYGVNNVVVEYVHGWDRPPATVSSAALARTAMLLMPSQTGSTVSSWTTPDGTTYSMDAAGQVTAAGTIRHYGVPAIDSVLNSPAYNAMGMAIA
jgi:hypothetical protein